MQSIMLKATLIALLTSTCLCLPALQAQPRAEPTARNLDTLKAQAVELRNSLTDEQRSEIRAILEENAPNTREEEVGRGALQGMDQAEQERIATINAGIRAILTQEQATIFDATLLPPPGEGAQSAQQSSDALTNGTPTDCYYAY